MKARSSSVLATVLGLMLAAVPVFAHHSFAAEWSCRRPVSGTGSGSTATATRSPDAAKITERFRRVNYGRLEIQITVDDPKAYTAPWTVKLNQPIVLNAELLDYVCLENEKDIAHMVGK